MKWLRQLLGLFRDSPTYGRDRANLISGFTIGTAALLLNGAVILMVMLLMLNPDDPDFRVITENVEFGQLLSLILLGGATVLATFLIPLRMITVFWGPRIGSYFDQIVLSGISPVRFVIGKVLSQNLLLALVLFLLLPYLVLSVTLGGMDFPTFIAGVFLVWLYCMALALVTLWLSLYMNELLAALFSIGGASLLIALGSIPWTPQPVIVTPAPALLNPLYRSLPFLDGFVTARFSDVFLSCSFGMAVLSVAALFGIYLGPLYGIIRENSTFGEVVRAGDSSKKRWFRLRHHIQRPSEISFFYENRGDRFRRSEGLIRWGLGFAGLLAAVAGFRIFFASIWLTVLNRPQGAPSWFAYDFHVSNLVIHGVTMVLAVFLFSHAKNTTYVRIPVALGRSAEVSRLDTIAFTLFMLFSTAATLAMPFWFDSYFGSQANITVFPAFQMQNRRTEIDFFRAAIEGTAVVTMSGIVLYAMHRLVCLHTWLRSFAAMASTSLFFVFICVVPMILAGAYFEFPEYRHILGFDFWGPLTALVSPVSTFFLLFREEFGRRYPVNTTAPFYIGQALIFVVALLLISRQGRTLRNQYMSESTQEEK